MAEQTRGWGSGFLPEVPAAHPLPDHLIGLLPRLQAPSCFAFFSCCLTSKLPGAVSWLCGAMVPPGCEFSETSFQHF